MNVPILPRPLHPSQEGLSIERLIRLANGENAEGNVFCGRAIVYNGKIFAHDGTHRLIIDWLRGTERVWMRVADVKGNPVKWK